MQLSPFLNLLTPEKLSLITITELMNLHGSGGVLDGMKTARALLSVGRAVESEYKAEMCKESGTSSRGRLGRTWVAVDGNVYIAANIFSPHPPAVRTPL